MELILIIVTALVFLLVGYRWGRNDGAEYYQTNSVKRGHAYWHVNEDGSTEFKWKENEK